MTNINATREAPVVCPVRRDIPSIPLALPLRFCGAEDINILLLGVWNSPKPKPHIAINKAIPTPDTLSAKTANKNKPPANIDKPIPPNSPA